MKTGKYPRGYLYKRIVQAKLFIDNNYADKIDIDSISDEACFSKFHFIRLFKQAYGKTPYQYLTHVRIQKAVQFLHQNKTVIEVCFLVGFESVSSFSGLFKRFAGIAPHAFLIREQNKKQQMHEEPLKYVPGCFAQRMVD